MGLAITKVENSSELIKIGFKLNTIKETLTMLIYLRNNEAYEYRIQGESDQINGSFIAYDMKDFIKQNPLESNSIKNVNSIKQIMKVMADHRGPSEVFDKDSIVKISKTLIKGLNKERLITNPVKTELFKDSGFARVRNYDKKEKINKRTIVIGKDNQNFKEKTNRYSVKREKLFIRYRSEDMIRKDEVLTKDSQKIQQQCFYDKNNKLIYTKNYSIDKKKQNDKPRQYFDKGLIKDQLIKKNVRYSVVNNRTSSIKTNINEKKQFSSFDIERRRQDPERIIETKQIKTIITLDNRKPVRLTVERPDSIGMSKSRSLHSINIFQNKKSKANRLINNYNIVSQKTDKGKEKQITNNYRTGQDTLLNLNIEKELRNLCYCGKRKKSNNRKKINQIARADRRNFDFRVFKESQKKRYQEKQIKEVKQTTIEKSVRNDINYIKDYLKRKADRLKSQKLIEKPIRDSRPLICSTLESEYNRTSNVILDNFRKDMYKDYDGLFEKRQERFQSQKSETRTDQLNLITSKANLKFSDRKSVV